LWELNEAPEKEAPGKSKETPSPEKTNQVGIAGGKTGGWKKEPRKRVPRPERPVHLDQKHRGEAATVLGELDSKLIRGRKKRRRNRGGPKRPMHQSEEPVVGQNDRGKKNSET